MANGGQGIGSAAAAIERKRARSGARGAIEGSPAPPPRSGQGVAAVDRALALLDSFIAADARGLAELAKATQLAKPTVLRLLASLDRAGYVVRLSDGRYKLGAKLMQLGATYRGSFRLEQHVVPVLEQLASKTRESAAFHIREGGHRLLLFRVESPQAVRDVPKPAALVPLDETSTGRVLKSASWPGESEDGRVLAYASAGVYDSQTASISTAVFAADAAAKPVLAGALTVSGPVERLGMTRLREIAGELVATARRLSVALGAPARSSPAPKLVRL